MATSRAAEHLGISNRTGKIAVGLEADIVFLRGNPVEDMANMRDVALVIADGDAHRPEDLLIEPAAP